MVAAQPTLCSSAKIEFFVQTFARPPLSCHPPRSPQKIPVVEGSRGLRSLLLSSGCANFSTTPAFVRQLFKRLASRPAGPAAPRAAHGVVANPAGANGAVSLRVGNSKARSNCILLLHYCLEDLGAGRGAGNGNRGGTSAAGGGSAGTGGYKELAGLPLVPLADGSHGTFRSFTAVDAQKLELIRGMGFSEARARQALTKHGEVQAAVEWLSSGGGGDDRGDAAERPFVLCGEEEACLLAGAGASLVSEASLSRTSGAALLEPDEGQAGAGTGRPGRPVGEDDGRVLRALRSPSLQSALNITTMRDDLLPDLIGQTLPAEWRGGGSSTASATAFPWTPGRGGHPDVDWFRRLWGYLAVFRPSAVRLLAESFPVVPTGNLVVCPLSLRSAVIDGVRLGGDVRSVLVKAGCRTLLPGVFAGSGSNGEDAATPTAPPSARGGSKAAAGNSPVAKAGQEGNTATATTAAAAASTDAAEQRPPPPPPAELFEYVRPGTREGVLAALGTARRSAGRPLKELMRAAVAAERDALRDFLAREPAGEMSDVEVAVCRTLPILPLHEDGLEAARALARAVTAAAAAAAAGTAVSPTARESESGDAYAAADAGPLYLLLEAGTGFVGVESKGLDGEHTSAVATATGAAPTSPQKWLESHLFTPSFVKVGGSGAGRKGAAEAALLERLGAQLIGRAAFFVDHVFPRVEELPNGLRDAAMVEALLAAPRLSQQHERFRGALAELEFVPTSSKVGGLLFSARDLGGAAVLPFSTYRGVALRCAEAFSRFLVFPFLWGLFVSFENGIPYVHEVKNNTFNLAVTHILSAWQRETFIASAPPCRKIHVAPRYPRATYPPPPPLRVSPSYPHSGCATNVPRWGHHHPVLLFPQIQTTLWEKKRQESWCAREKSSIRRCRNCRRFSPRRGSRTLCSARRTSLPPFARWAFKARWIGRGWWKPRRRCRP